MELSKTDTKILKGIAILLMVVLHLFATKDTSQFASSLLINGVPLTYYIGLMGDACRPIYLFVTGYVFYIMVANNKGDLAIKHLKRILKLFINYWVVFLLFVPLGIAMGAFKFEITKFILSFFGLIVSYNGAWWFLQIYIIFVALSPILIKIIQKSNSLVLMMFSGVIYILSHFQRYHTLIDFGDNVFINEVVRISHLMGTSQLSFLVGALFFKHQIYSKIHSRFFNMKYKNVLCMAGFLLLILFHAVIESSIIAPIIGIVFICLFTLMDKNPIVHKILDFTSNHSTNIWLTHMFFYMTMFPTITYAPKYPLLIFLWLIILCIASSYIIKLFTNPAMIWVDGRKVTLKATSTGAGASS